MKKVFISFIALLFFLLLNVGCGGRSVPLSRIDDKDLLRFYYITGDNNIIRVSAYFYVDAIILNTDYPEGTAVRLDRKSLITCNDITLKRHKGESEFYSVKLDEWPETFDFIWIDQNGTQHRDILKVDKIEFDENWLVRDGSNQKINWVGSPVRPFESIYFSINNQGVDSVWEISEIGATSIDISDTKVPPLLPTVKIERRYLYREGSFDYGEHSKGIMFRVSYIYMDL